MVKPTDIPRWRAAKPSPSATWVLPVPLLPTAITFSLCWMYSHRASSITKALFSGGMDGKLNRRRKKLDGQGEAHLIALACSPPPEGRVSWTFQMLADRLVEWEIVEIISDETVRRTLKKRTQALAERMLVYPTLGQRGIRLRHGGRAGGLSPPVRWQRSSGVLGRDQ